MSISDLTIAAEGPTGDYPNKLEANAAPQQIQILVPKPQRRESENLPNTLLMGMPSKVCVCAMGLKTMHFIKLVFRSTDSLTARANS